MVERSGYEPGTPSWVDLQTPDLEASKSFYGELFGWSAETSTDPAAGGYTMFMLRGRSVAGAGPQMNPGPPAWTSYVTVTDADEAMGKVEAAGGTVFMPPMDVLDAGRMAVFADSQGAVMAVWQPKEHNGAGIVNESNSYSWNELATRDIEKAKRFYGDVFGWDSETHAMGPMSYTEWKLGGQSIGGMMEMGPQYPTDTPPHWAVYFSVDDCDATVARVQELGGSVTAPPMDIPQGRFAFLTDPQGALFAVMQPAAG